MWTDLLASKMMEGLHSHNSAIKIAADANVALFYREAQSRSLLRSCMFRFVASIRSDDDHTDYPLSLERSCLSRMIL
jgi:hypothetical protein